jgi:hypothetical protein
MATLFQLRECQLGCGSDQRRSMLAGQPVEVVKPPATRRGRWGRGPNGPPPRKAVRWKPGQVWTKILFGRSANRVHSLTL